MVLVWSEDLTAYEDIFFADRTFFDVFDFPLTEGDARKALTEPYCIVITGSVAPISPARQARSSPAHWRASKRRYSSTSTRCWGAARFHR